MGAKLCTLTFMVCLTILKESLFLLSCLAVDNKLSLSALCNEPCEADLFKSGDKLVPALLESSGSVTMAALVLFSGAFGSPSNASKASPLNFWTKQMTCERVR